MITLIEAKNFRCLRDMVQPLDAFQVLVGPNASGKTTFLDVIEFLGQLVSRGLEETINERTQNFNDLIWGRGDGGFQLAIEATIPNHRRALIYKNVDTIRYEVSLEMDPESQEFGITKETVVLKNTAFASNASQEELTVIKNIAHGFVQFNSEVAHHTIESFPPAFNFGRLKTGLGNLPEDETMYPATTWLKKLLKEGVQKIMLNSLAMRKASPPGKGTGFKPDGSNLPWVIHHLQQKHPELFADWIAHLQTALPEIVNIKTIERLDDRHRYLVLCYQGGLEVPSWMASDGTLRLLALTLPAYMPGLTGIFLIEEPENGIHPRAVETIYQSLSSVYDAQVLLATHSPVILSLVKPSHLLCFTRTAEGETKIINGKDHPNLKEWKGETNLGVLFAGGVLG